MKYRNASDILPDHLLKEVQKYTAGEILYIPTEKERRQWGAGSGARLYYEQRNEAIREGFRQHESIGELAEKHHLSEDTIRKIVYR